MSKQLFANEKVMTQYLGALLRDDGPIDNLEPVAKLLEKIPNGTDQEQLQAKESNITEKTDEQIQSVVAPKPLPSEKVVTDNIIDVTDNTAAQLSEKPSQALKTQSQEDYFEGEFQALFFEVAGLTLAVPLKSLGGIHQLSEVNHLFGKPKWFKGVMLNRDEKLNVVDTARWVMPEKYDEKLEASLNYQYLITLGDSQWGLLAEKLINNITLSKEDVKWNTNKGKRPWLAGVIKEKMCALIDVDNLNALLEKGLDSRQ
ncbi:chemotaxis protein CheW [Pseudoalteromonas aliena]|uniref:Purine-binding chemotaxis protein CheW n=1 Tax=Pseudoalteromonas aliena SW19 TaxID=1314866 RepID=A0ABR9E0T4_9GAMM|nr:chemotaxis protein CheW [Pseudoalteromonas aliena]MBE0360214.1 purine-binding chemotaxis protein CheW [Pseudoalteromonas aliena SW19]